MYTQWLWWQVQKLQKHKTDATPLCSEGLGFESLLMLCYLLDSVTFWKNRQQYVSMYSLILNKFQWNTRILKIFCQYKLNLTEFRGKKKAQFGGAWLVFISTCHKLQSLKRREQWRKWPNIIHISRPKGHSLN